MATGEREIFARNLRAQLQKKGMKQVQLAEQLGISRGTVSDYLKGDAYPRPQKMAKLCEILGVSQYDLTTDFYSEGDFVPNREVLALAKELYENQEARAIFVQLMKICEEENVNLDHEILMTAKEINENEDLKSVLTELKTLDSEQFKLVKCTILTLKKSSNTPKI